MPERALVALPQLVVVQRVERVSQVARALGEPGRLLTQPGGGLV